MNIKVHTIPNGDSYIYYGTDTMELYKSHLDNFIDSSHTVNEDNVHKLNKESIKDYACIDQITLCVSNDCNLRCKYCYAQGGNYGEQRTFMQESTARQFVAFCIREFKKVNRILFFGGEPFLNWRVIKTVCELFKKVCAKSHFPLPIFTVITNGTVYNKEIFDIIRQHISLVTISIDGKKEINDANRVYTSGKGTYQAIDRFIKQVTSYNNCLVRYEATYTERHLSAGVSRYDTTKYLQSNFGIRGDIVDELSLQRTFPLDEFNEISNKVIYESNFDCLPKAFWKVLRLVTTKESATFCPIYQDRITVTSNGDIVPCQMIIGKPNSTFGSIFDTNLSESQRPQNRDFKDNASCKTCWCNKLCGGCSVNQFYSFKDNNFLCHPIEDKCKYTRKYIEQILLLIYRVRTDTRLWELLLNKIKGKAYL